MLMGSILAFCVLLGVSLLSHEVAGSDELKEPNGSGESDTNRVDGEPYKSKNPKLLVIMLDGFRWDYYNQHKIDLDVFDYFISEGIQADWLEPVFPSVSYPNWHTISTGLFPERHGILGNYMYDQRSEAVFDLDHFHTTTNPVWWQSAEPIWTTATRERKKVFLRHWSRCDVPFEETLPNGDISGYRPDPGILAFQTTLNVTLHKLRDHDLLMVYAEHIDNVGHEFGPDSVDMTLALRDVNRALKLFLDELYDHYEDIEKELNIVILSDHGMVESGTESNMTHVYLKRHLNPNHVLKVLGFGGFVTIAPLFRHSKEVYERLKEMEGVDVYKRDEIPEEFHYKGNRLTQEILVVAKPGYHIMGLPQEISRYGTLEVKKQIPKAPLEMPRRRGSHGYANLTEMRGIFFAKGPEFKKGLSHPALRMEDVYLILTRVMKIGAQPNNGTWSRVSGMFKSGSTPANKPLIVLPLAFCSVLLLSILSKLSLVL